MDSTLILVKTDKGIDEVKHRSFGLPQTLRALLIMADGSISMAGLLTRTAQIPKVEESIEWLVREGFIESVSPSGRRTAPSASPAVVSGGANGQALAPKQALIAISRELLGADAPKVLQRLTEAGESLSELNAAVERCHKFIKLTIDEKKAEQFLKACQSLLAEAR
ncbi:MAG: hypothetical protein Q8R72_16570 [Hylemonella sp.]|nr:hypothetical protein [Hylemonella sp.]